MGLEDVFGHDDGLGGGTIGGSLFRVGGLVIVVGGVLEPLKESWSI